MKIPKKPRTRTQLSPLRKIIQVLNFADDIYGSQKVALECGHEVLCSSHAMYRARCWRCKKEQAN